MLIPGAHLLNCHGAPAALQETRAYSSQREGGLVSYTFLDAEVRYDIYTDGKDMQRPYMQWTDFDIQQR